MVITKQHHKKLDADILVVKFASVIDIYRHVDIAIAHPEKSKSQNTALNIKNMCINDKSFVGCYWRELVERRYKWDDGLKKVKRLAAMDAIVNASSFEKRWSDYDGDDMDVERYYNEQPFLSRRIKVAGEGRRGQYRIVVNISENAQVRASNMLWKAYAASRLCDEIESQGNRCEVVLCDFTRGQNPGYQYTYTEVVVKRAQDQVNLSLLCTAMSPWMLRANLFSIWYHFTECSYGLGRSASVRSYYEEDAEEHAVIIDRGDCLSHEAANTFIRTMDLGTQYQI